MRGGRETPTTRILHCKIRWTKKKYQLNYFKRIFLITQHTKRNTESVRKGGGQRGRRTAQKNTVYIPPLSFFFSPKRDDFSFENTIEKVKTLYTTRSSPFNALHYSNKKFQDGWDSKNIANLKSLAKFLIFFSSLLLFFLQPTLSCSLFVYYNPYKTFACSSLLHLSCCTFFYFDIIPFSDSWSSWYVNYSANTCAILRKNIIINSIIR